MTTEFRLPMHQAPPRKPVPNTMHHGYAYQSYDAPHTQQLSPHPSAASLAHNRRRTSSSHVLPYSAAQQQYPVHPAPHQTMAAPAPYPPSRRLSSATTSTSSTGNNLVSSGNSGDIRRSTSSRSAHSQLGYVALMRRQKATVWCDRSQPEDPRIRAQKLVDKKRAYLEVHGAGAGRTGTLGSGKAKHAKGTTDFSPSTLVGAKVPVRLSANEVGDDADDDAHSDSGFLHRRTNSGHSSLKSNRYPSGYQRPQGTMGSNSTPPNEKTDLPEVSEHPPAEKLEEEKDIKSAKDDAATTHSRASEPEDSFGTVGDMAAPSAAVAASQKAKKADELRRRGSVDDRTTSMTRLFVANPDLSD
ncbi:hypothetical protein ASPWEDRAFT_114603 [Aspergillus wentii DTO 134E9]|uniref:Uncharacterized protein n=1 Tax=Aspergillus wentii DTO 134E9 TaxID=1073089 RepID=A0A1L9RDP0_ASPWE|nr:uncharacterized protein ASPWEDRAFT_114603 [Aspergillus wentii DTO 134E9]KAI9933305.1 hypothetical protein MW887_007778 [Aspergillus wentii]OJJ33035.1 hypothetical protein ASPWEDRAFT_114603 [Aspergillus wentii DTO 134E9]